MLENTNCTITQSTLRGNDRFKRGKVSTWALMVNPGRLMIRDCGRWRASDVDWDNAKQKSTLWRRCVQSWCVTPLVPLGDVRPISIAKMVGLNQILFKPHTLDSYPAIYPVSTYSSMSIIPAFTKSLIENVILARSRDWQLPTHEKLFQKLR